jgi:hypothetical protein
VSHANARASAQLRNESTRVTGRSDGSDVVERLFGAPRALGTVAAVTAVERIRVGITAYDASVQREPVVSMDEAAARLGISIGSVKRLT